MTKFRIMLFGNCVLHSVEERGGGLISDTEFFVKNIFLENIFFYYSYARYIDYSISKCNKKSDDKKNDKKILHSYQKES